MKTYGIIGFPLEHSFSKSYFESKFENENITAEFLNFELPNIADFSQVLRENPNLRGLSVTIPYKEKIIPFLTEIDESVKEIGAVNSIKITKEGDLIGYNTDYYGFGKSLDEFLPSTNCNALILGTGGASKAIAYALKLRNIPYKLVSRTPKNAEQFAYEDLNANILQKYQLIINTTPLGTFPNTATFPKIPYQFLTVSHFLFDLVYNPTETAFMRKGKEMGAKAQNGYDMLVYQAEKSWSIWNR